MKLEQKRDQFKKAERRINEGAEQRINEFENSRLEKARNQQLMLEQEERERYHSVTSTNEKDYPILMYRLTVLYKSTTHIFSKKGLRLSHIKVNYIRQ